MSIEHKAERNPSKHIYRLQEAKITLAYVGEILARGIGSGIVAAGGTYAFENFSGKTSMVQAAEVCQADILAMTFLYAPNPDKSPNGLVVTQESFVVPINVPQFGNTKLLYRPNPNAAVSDRNPEKVIDVPIGRVENKEMGVVYGEGQTKVEEVCNTKVDGKPGLFLEWEQRRDIPDYCNTNGQKARKSVTVANKGKGAVVSGQIASSQTIDSLVKSTTREIKKVGTLVDRRVRDVLRIKPNFTVPEDRGTEYFTYIKLRADQIKAISDTIKNTEEKCSKPQPTATSQSQTAPRPESTPQNPTPNNPEPTRSNQRPEHLTESGVVRDWYRTPVIGLLRRLWNLDLTSWE